MQDGGKEAELDTAEIQQLAYMEHQRWLADRRINGWKFAKHATIKTSSTQT